MKPFFTNLFAKFIKVIAIFISFFKKKVPKAMTAISDPKRNAFLDSVEQEIAKKIGVDVLHHFH
jgi:hypothetical protein